MTPLDYKAHRLAPRLYPERTHVGFNRATRKNPCPVCGAKKYCQTTRDGALAHCMKQPAGSVKRARDGGYIHVLVNGSDCRITEGRQPIASRAIGDGTGGTGTRVELAPLRARDAAYRELIELSPAHGYERELLVAEPDGLLSRGLLMDDVHRLGALPPRVEERDRLAARLDRFLRERFPSPARDETVAGVIGVPGFWRASSGRIKLGRDYDYKRPALIIPYRDERDRIQACQLRFAGAKGAYHWLSTPEDKLDEEPHGTSSGCPLHWTRATSAATLPNDLPLLVTEGALKAEVFVSLRPPMRAIAVAGVGVAHAEVVRATRGRDVLIGFDSDHRRNAQVCRQLGKLIAARNADARLTDSKGNTYVVIWEGPKGIDEAALRSVPLRVIGVCEWVKTLTGEPLVEVLDVWNGCDFLPREHNHD